MIYLERTIDVKKGVGSIDEPVILYKGDKNVEVQFTIKNNPFKSKNSLTPTYGQLVIDREATSIFSTVSSLSNGKVLFVITEQMIDELIEIGEYTFQIRLFNDDKSSRATLPVIDGGIIIKQPICDGEEGAVNVATVNVSTVLDSEPEETFNQDGSYNKTIWTDGDLITDSKLNKVENAIDFLAQNNGALVDLSDYATKDEIPTKLSELENDANFPTEAEVNTNITMAVIKRAEKDHKHDEYITDEELNSKGYLTEHQSLDDYALKTDIPNVDGYATEQYVQDAIGDIDSILDVINGEVL